MECLSDVSFKRPLCFIRPCVFTVAVDSLAAARRKSNCVKEVERIKQRREERRAAQQAIREQQETEIDTDTPNWEFALMIR